MKAAAAAAMGDGELCDRIRGLLGRGRSEDLRKSSDFS